MLGHIVFSNRERARATIAFADGSVLEVEGEVMQCDVDSGYPDFGLGGRTAPDRKLTLRMAQTGNGQWQYRVPPPAPPETQRRRDDFAAGATWAAGAYGPNPPEVVEEAKRRFPRHRTAVVDGTAYRWASGRFEYLNEAKWARSDLITVSHGLVAFPAMLPADIAALMDVMRNPIE